MKHQSENEWKPWTGLPYEYNPQCICAWCKNGGTPPTTPYYQSGGCSLEGAMRENFHIPLTSPFDPTNRYRIK